MPAGARRSTRREVTYGEQGLRLLPMSRFSAKIIRVGNAAPRLGAGPAVLYDGWSRIQNANQDEGSVQFTGFSPLFTLNGTDYSSCYINANAYATFGGTANIYSAIAANNPSFPKLLFGPGDLSFQRVYTRVLSGVNTFRWEGHSAFSGDSPGLSNRIVEATFTTINSLPVVEIRVGNYATPGGTLMLATATTSLASTTLAANSSYVFEGNSGGTSWTVTSSRYVE